RPPPALRPPDGPPPNGPSPDRHDPRAETCAVPPSPSSPPVAARAATHRPLRPPAQSPADGGQAMIPAPFERAQQPLPAILARPALRPELDLEDMPAPQRLAPYAAALSGSVYREDDTEAAMGRLIVLYDPESPTGWTNDFRIVAYIRADL